MARVMSEDLPGVQISFELEAHAFVAALHGPRPGAQESLFAWNIQEWAVE